MKLTVATKVIMLVAIPLACEVSIFAVLTTFNNEAEAQAAKDKHALDLSDAVHDLIANVLGSRKGFKGYSDGGYLEACQHIRKTYRLWQHDVAKIRKLMPPTDKGQKVMDDTEAALNDAMAAINEAAAQFEGAGAIDFSMVKKESIRRIEAASQQIISPAVLQLARDSARQAGGDRQQALRQAARTALNCLLLASVAISLALALYSSKQISGRIKRVSDNTRRFANDEELLPALSGSDEIADLDSVFHDMAERIDEFISEQKEAYESIRRAERMKADVVAMVTHDLRAPLNSIVHFQEMLESGLFGPINDKGQHLLRLAGHSSRTMQTLISDLLDLEKIASGRLQLSKRRVFLSEIIDQAISTVKIMADENDVEIVHEPVETVLEVDPDRICQVITNLLSNAIKFSPAKSQIIIAVTPQSKSVRVSVIDQGPGIAEDQQELIFERFQQAKSEKSHLGSGLGLSICKALISLHKGTIWVESEVGRGSSFSFKLPV